MSVKDLLTLVGAKLKIRKLRTIITIFTTSLLFGVIIAILFIVSGFFNNLTTLAKTTFEGNVLLVVNRETPGLGDLKTKTEVVERSAEQNKASRDAIAELVKPYRGSVVASMNHYCAAGSIFIERLTPQEVAHFMNCVDNPGESVVTFDNDTTISPLIKISAQKDDTIQVLMPFNQAAQISGIDKPSANDPNSAARLKSYVNKVNEKAIGLQFTGTLTDGNQTSKINYEIVGLLPPKNLSTLDSQSINPLENILTSLISSDGTSESYSFIVTNPQSTEFQTFYGLNADRFTNDTVVSFEEAQAAESFIKEHNQGSEFITNQITLRSTANTINRAIEAFTIVFSIIAVVIMAGTISRVIDDERQTIALYRAVGGTTKNILTIFICYVLSISLFAVICSTFIGIFLAIVVTTINTGFITANISAMYNISNLSPIVFIGFDFRILLVYLSIIVISFACLLFVIGKLTAKNLAKDLKK